MYAGRARLVRSRETSVPERDPGAVQLDVLGIVGIEKTTALAEKHWDDMDLDFVQNSRSEGKLRGPGGRRGTPDGPLDPPPARSQSCSRSP